MAKKIKTDTSSNAVEVSDDAKIDVKSAEARVYNKDGNYVRSYTHELHGKEFLDYAKEFAKKIGGSVK